MTWRRLTGWTVAAAAAAAAVVATGILPASPPAPPASAAQVLQRAATAAVAQPVPRGSQFIYTETRMVSKFQPTRVARTWASVDGARQGARTLTPCPADYDLRMVPRHLPAGWFYYGGMAYRPSCVMSLPGDRPSPAPESYAGLRRRNSARRFSGRPRCCRNGRRNRPGTVFEALAVLQTGITNTAPTGPFNVQTPLVQGPGHWH